MFGGSTLWESVSERWKLRETLSNVQALHLQRGSLRSKEARRKLRLREKNVRNVCDARRKSSYGKLALDRSPNPMENFLPTRNVAEVFLAAVQSTRWWEKDNALPSVKIIPTFVDNEIYVRPKENMYTFFF